LFLSAVLTTSPLASLWAAAESSPDRGKTDNSSPAKNLKIDLDQAINVRLPAITHDLKPADFRTTDGKDGWVIRIPGAHPIATPAYADGLLFVGGGYGSHEFYAFNAKTGEVAWKISTSDDGPTAAVGEFLRRFLLHLSALSTHSLWNCPLRGGIMHVVERLLGVFAVDCNSSSELRLILGGAKHESTSPASLLPRASARTLVLCLVFLRMHYCCASRLSDAPPHDHSLCDHQLKPKHTDSNRNPANDQNRLIHIQTP
jgi:hypothetical protein